MRIFDAYESGLLQHITLTFICSGLLHVSGKWCAMFDYDGYPGPGKCWYGLDAMECNPEESYIAKCGNEIRQRFLFVKVNDEEVLIKLGNGDNTCWERNGRAIFLRDCDSSNSLQRWFAPNGSFDGERFEISQKGYERQCVSTAHHPKAGEYMYALSCGCATKCKPF